MNRSFFFATIFAFIIFATASCSDDGTNTEATTTSPNSSTETSAASMGEEKLIVLADTGDCRKPSEIIAEQVTQKDATILIAGDLAYPDGSQKSFDECFLPHYKDNLDRIYAVPGDNDYKTDQASAYWETIINAGEKNKGWYSIEKGNWQIIALNTECSQIKGCDPESEQYQWLQETLEASDHQCRIAFWHKPRFTSSANYQGIAGLQPLYELLYEAGTDLLLAGNSHHYERFAPLDPDGQVDQAAGIRNFTVGIGGAPFTQFGDPLSGSEIRNNDTRGYLEISLREKDYQWDFKKVGEKGTLVDSGQADCLNEIE